MMTELFYVRDLQDIEKAGPKESGRRDLLYIICCLFSSHIQAVSTANSSSLGYYPARVGNEDRNRIKSDINKIRPRGLMAKALDFGLQQLIPLEIPGSTPGVVD